MEWAHIHLEKWRQGVLKGTGIIDENSDFLGVNVLLYLDVKEKEAIKSNVVRLLRVTVFFNVSHFFLKCWNIGTLKALHWFVHAAEL